MGGCPCQRVVFNDDNKIPTSNKRHMTTTALLELSHVITNPVMIDCCLIAILSSSCCWWYSHLGYILLITAVNEISIYRRTDKFPLDIYSPIKWKIGQMLTKNKLIKKLINDKIKWILSFIYIVNHDCNERFPQCYMIAIMNTLYKGQHKRLQLMI